MGAVENVECPVVVGTAGHVDHGKSALVLAMTGVDPDRLPQEKARGITVDLGFAELTLPDGRVVGLVDVPGHGHYVRAMVSGATGVDVALLVVAADDGVMPQTREHVRILELLGVRHMVVALTKSDLADPEWLELAQADVEDYLSRTAFAGAAVVPCSSRTGQGVDQVAEALREQVDVFIAAGEQERRASQPARLPVDRVFTVAGAGTVVTGTAAGGTFSPGDEVEIHPGGARARVRGVQVHGHDIDRAVAGQRTALNLVGAPTGAVQRGCTVAAPGSLGSFDRFDARLRWQGRDGSSEPLVSGDRVHVCTKTSQCVGRVLLFDSLEALGPGESALVQVRLDEPLALRAHDPFVVMSYSPVELVGGGEVLRTGVARRSTLRPGESELLQAVESRDDRSAVAAYLRTTPVPVSAARAAEDLDLPAPECSDLLASLAAETAAASGQDAAHGVVELPGRGQSAPLYMAVEALDQAVARIAGALRDEHGQGSWGVPLLTLRDAACPQVGDDVFPAIAEVACGRGVAERFGSSLASPEHAKELREKSEGLAGRVDVLLQGLGVAAPFADEIASQQGMDPADVLRALRILKERGRAEEFGRSYYLGADAARDAREVVRRTIEERGGSAKASELREALGLSRKYALPLLEHLDAEGFTVRDHDDPAVRRLRG